MRGLGESAVHRYLRGSARRAALVLAVLLVLAAPAMAGAELRGPERSTSTELAQKRYVAAGTRAYVVGAENGSFPPMGWHIRGEMGGVWAHPIKLLDGYWFAVDGGWLPTASSFTSGAGYVRLLYPLLEGGVRVTRTEVAPDGRAVVLIRLRIANTTSRARSVDVMLDARSDILAAYPWGWTTPSARDFNQPDLASYNSETGTLSFRETGKPWWAMVRSSIRPLSGATGMGFWGPVPAGARSEYYEYGDPPAGPDEGATGRVEWRLTVGPDSARTLWLAVAGSHLSEAAATRAATDALVHPDRLLARKNNSRLRLLARTRVRLPDASLTAALEWGKLNMADLRRTVTQAQIRDVDEGHAYPPPVAVLRSLSGIGAGYPDYPWLFGTDGAYTAYPLVASGQWETAKAHLASIMEVSRAINGASGKVVHEVVTDGSMYWGALRHRGNTNETAQFATAVDLVWRWTGDDGFRRRMYAFVRDGMRTITSPGCPVDPDPEPAEGTCDNDGDGWPEGSGMVEREGMGQEKLDVTAYTWEALGALARMATAAGDAATTAWAHAKAADLRKRLDAAWWMSGERLYADSLCDPPMCAAEDTRLQQRHWINATPAETGMAPPRRARALLDRLESPTFTGECGLFHTGRGGGPTGEGELKCWTLPNSVLAVGEARFGRLGASGALYYMHRGIANHLDLEMPGALPEIAPGPQYDPFVDFRERAMFMQAWSSYGVQWPVIRYFLGIDPNVPAGRLTVVPDVPDSWPRLSVGNLRVGGGKVRASAGHHGNRYTTAVHAPAGWRLVIGHVLPRDATVDSVRLDGRPTPYRLVETARGLEVRVVTDTDRPHRLAVSELTG